MAPTDYKERTARSRSKRSSKTKRPVRKSTANGVSRWRWFSVGLCVGAIATAALFLYEPSVVKQVASSKAANAAHESPKPKFEFYALLPEKETAIPETEPVPARQSAAQVKLDKARQESKQQQKAAPRAPQDRYMLQVGSFKSNDDADQVKAKLALLGFIANIQTISVNGRETWHRVQVGPFTGRSNLDEAQDSLKTQGFEVMPLRLKGRE